jgi:hypothetical protein
MASNEIPKKREQLFAAAQDVADGLKAYETRLGIKQTTEEQIRMALAAAVSANTKFNLLTAAHVSSTAALKASARNARAFLLAAKGVLQNSLGRRWSSAWLPAGFTGSTLQVPTDVAEQQTLLESLRKYFETNPDREVAALKVTASEAGAHLEALKNARAAVVAGNSAVNAAKEERKQTEQELRLRFRALIVELGLVLNDDDPTWYAFGLSRPSDPKTPAIPKDVSVTAGLPGTIFVSWAAAPRADRYKIYKKEEGDADFQAAATTVVREALLTDLKGGRSVEIQVSAINIAGESLPSVPVEIVVPPESAPTVQG